MTKKHKENKAKAKWQNKKIKMMKRLIAQIKRIDENDLSV